MGPTKAIFVTLCTWLATPAYASKNVALFLVDDLGSASLGFAASVNGRCSTVETKVAQHLASQGTIFDYAYASSSVCAPSRASIQVGMGTAGTRYYYNAIQLDYNPSYSIASLLKKQSKNIKTGFLGKWHLGSKGPGAVGYDLHDGATGNQDGHSKNPNDPKKMKTINEKAKKFVTRHKNRQFFLFMSHYAVHGPLQSTKQALAKAKTDAKCFSAEWNAMLNDLDKTLGDFINHLKVSKVDSKTYLIYTSDNGSQMNYGFSKPLTGGKRFHTEGGIRVPFFITGPNVRKQRSNQRVSLEDLLPTVLSLMGVSSSNIPNTVEGIDLSPNLFGISNHLYRPSGALYFYRPYGDMQLGNEKSKEVLFSALPYATFGPNGVYGKKFDGKKMYKGRPLLAEMHPVMVRIQGSMKFVINMLTGKAAIFNIEKDSDESHNLIQHETPRKGYSTATLTAYKASRDYLHRFKTYYPSILKKIVSSQTDDDRDGLPDHWEMKYLLTTGYSGSDDPDGDGKTNTQEYADSTDPLDANQGKRFCRFHVSSSGSTITTTCSGFPVGYHKFNFISDSKKTSVKYLRVRRKNSPATFYFKSAKYVTYLVSAFWLENQYVSTCENLYCKE